jgi:hypothetical protein
MSVRDRRCLPAVALSVTVLLFTWWFRLQGKRRHSGRRIWIQQQGRTAICMTGHPRTLFLPTEHLKMHTDVWPHELTMPTFNKSAFAVEQRDLVVAHSIRVRVLDVLARQGGYDLFVVETGDVLSTGWDVLDSRITSSTGPNQRIMMLGGPEPAIWYNRSDKVWDQYLKWGPDQGFTATQNFLYQMRQQTMCNQAVHSYSVRRGVKYMYKLRLRPDWAWLEEMPSPGEITSERSIRIPGGWAACCGHWDTMALGHSHEMDVYFFREHEVHSFYPWNGTTTVEAEHYVQHYMQKHGIDIIEDGRLLGVKVHAAGAPVAKGRCYPTVNSTHKCNCKKNFDEASFTCVPLH